MFKFLKSFFEEKKDNLINIGDYVLLNEKYKNSILKIKRIAIIDGEQYIFLYPYTYINGKYIKRKINYKQFIELKKLYSNITNVKDMNKYLVKYEISQILLEHEDNNENKELTNEEDRIYCNGFSLINNYHYEYGKVCFIKNCKNFYNSIPYMPRDDCRLCNEYSDIINKCSFSNKVESEEYENLLNSDIKKCGNYNFFINDIVLVESNSYSDFLLCGRITKKGYSRYNNIYQIGDEIIVAESEIIKKVNYGEYELIKKELAEISKDRAYYLGNYKDKVIRLTSNNNDDGECKTAYIDSCKKEEKYGEVRNWNYLGLDKCNHFEGIINGVPREDCRLCKYDAGCMYCKYVSTYLMDNS